MNLDDFVIEYTAANLEALKKIDKNKKGFLCVVENNKNKKLLGTLTDGDIRRAFINGKTMNDTIGGEYSSSCKYLNSTDSIGDVISYFKSDAIDFLPIINENKEIFNIITKRQLHVLLLKDISINLSYDFLSVDESLVDYEIYSRPWGFYKTTVKNDYFQSKLLTVYPLGTLSLQSHNQREEYWVIAHGKGKVQIGESVIEVKCGSSLFIPKGCKHRLINTDEKENLVLTEVQIGDYFGEDDIVRYEDIYGRD